MPLIEYVAKRFNRTSQVVIQQANEIIAAYQEQGFKLTLRQLYYQFVSRDLIPNNIKSYKRLGSIINDARLAGLIDWDLPCVPTVDAIREGVKLAGGVQQEQPPAQQHEQQGGKPLFVCNDKHEIGFGNDDDAIHLMDCVDSRILTNTLNAAVAAHTEKLRQRIAELELAGGVE